MELSGVEASTPVASLLTTVGTLSWLGGIWGLGILAGMVGGALASTQVPGVHALTWLCSGGRGRRWCRPSLESSSSSDWSARFVSSNMQS